jgi:hypothetical protein
MKHTPLVVLVLALSVGCSDQGHQVVPSADDVINHTGVVKQMSSDAFIIISDYIYQGQNEHFAPTNLPDSFKTDGLRVLFSGKRGEIPPNVRMMGTPLTLSSIEIDIH